MQPKMGKGDICVAVGPLEKGIPLGIFFALSLSQEIFPFHLSYGTVDSWFMLRSGVVNEIMLARTPTFFCYYYY